MRKIIAITSSAVLALSLGSAIAAPAAAKNVPLKKAQPTFLFSMYAKQATIKKVKGDVYALKIERSDISNLIEFSNRPYRIVENVTVDSFAKQWKEKTNNFTTNSPNVAISAQGLKPHVVVMTGMKLEPGAVDYLLESKSVIKDGAYANASFFVDGTHYGCFTGSPAHCFGPIHP